jgi:hypothetical protein
MRWQKTLLELRRQVHEEAQAFQVRKQPRGGNVNDRCNSFRDGGNPIESNERLLCDTSVDGWTRRWFFGSLMVGPWAHGTMEDPLLCRGRCYGKDFVDQNQIRSFSHYNFPSKFVVKIFLARLQRQPRPPCVTVLKAWTRNSLNASIPLPRGEGPFRDVPDNLARPVRPFHDRPMA